MADAILPGLWSPTEGTDQTVDIEYLRSLLGTKIFGATFVKRDGTLRSGSFRLGVRKELTGAGSSYDRFERGNLTVWDMTKKAYRTIRIAALRQISFGGRVVDFQIREDTAVSVLVVVS